MRRTLSLFLTSALLALLFVVPSAPAQAAAPSSAPSSVTVTRQSGGYVVSWTAVSGASSYRIYRQKAVRTETGSTSRVTGYEWVTYANVDGSTRSWLIKDETAHFPETAGTYSSPAFAVAGFNTTGVGPKKSDRAGCASGYFIAARGSGQNPAAGTYAHGLGTRGRDVYDDARVRLGLSRSQFQARMVHYPAQNLADWRLLDGAYQTSVNEGRDNVEYQLEGIASACPASWVVLFGYSQGAHAVGNGFQAANAAGKDAVAIAELFADPWRNPWDSGITYRPDRDYEMGIYADTRALGGVPRPSFSGLTSSSQIQQWCLRTDDVCSWDRGGFTLHGSAYIDAGRADPYECYERYAAYSIAYRARTLNWRTSPNLTVPSCTLVE